MKDILLVMNECFLFFRPLIQGMPWQSQFMLVCLSGWLNKLTNHWQLAKGELADPLAFLIYMDLNHLKYVSIIIPLISLSVLLYNFYTM